MSGARPAPPGAHITWNTDATTYGAPEFYARECAQIFDRAWLIATSVGVIARVGDSLTTKIMGRSLLLVRGEDGRVRAFHNSCLHRGTRLMEGRRCLKDITCPYHGWVYGLDGALTKIPGREGIHIGVDARRLKLHEVHTAESSGFVWVNFDRDPPPLTTFLRGLDDDVSVYRLEEMRAIDERSWEIPCNWKAVVDNAVEVYHIPSVHPQTVKGVVPDQPQFETYGDHSLQTMPIAPGGWRRWVDKRTSRGGPYSPTQLNDLHKYLIFPNTVLNVLPYHLTVLQMWPSAADRCTLFYGFYGRKGAAPLEWLRVRGAWMLSRRVMTEDRRIFERFQQGVLDGEVKTHWFHDTELAVGHHHATVNRWVEMTE
jgi:choline monooxygenase